MVLIYTSETRGQSTGVETSSPTMFVLIGILTICSAGFKHLVAVVKMGNWLISFNVYI